MRLAALNSAGLSNWLATQNSAVQNSGPEIVQTSAVSQYRPTMDSLKVGQFISGAVSDHLMLVTGPQEAQPED
jgi:hypothetical protein